MLTVERFILSHTLEFSANSPQEKNCLKSAIAQLDEASKCFEKLLVTQRKDNLRVIKDAYVELQRKALGMKTPQKDKGLSR